MARKKNLSEMEDDEAREDDFDYGEEPDFNDPDDFEEDITDEELMPEIMRMQPKVRLLLLIYIPVHEVTFVTLVLHHVLEIIS